MHADLSARSARSLLSLVAISISACGGGGSGTPPPMSYTVGGTISGLHGTGLVLVNSGGSNLSVASNSTSFTFATALASGDPYNVTVMTQPSGPSQTCTVANGSGAVAGSSITNVRVTCNNVSEELVISDMQGSSAAFLIDPVTGSLRSTGIPTGLTATGPMATDPAGKFVFALNSTPPGIFAYTVDSSGALSQVAGSPFLAPVNPDLRGLVVDPTGKFLYSGSASGALAYAIDGTTGVISLITGSPFAGPPLGTPPGSATCPCVATHTFLYYAQYLGVGSFRIDAFGINTTTGALTSVGSAGIDACCTDDIHATTDPAQRFFYLIGGPSVASYTIDGSTGALTNTGGVGAPAPTLWIGIVIDPTGKFAYVLDGSPSAGSNLYAYSINSTSGVLTPLSPGAIATGGGELLSSFDVNGNYLYVTSQYPTAIWAYSFNSTTGALTPVAGSPFVTTFIPGAMVVTSLP